MYTEKNIFEKVDCIDKAIVLLSEIAKDIKKSFNNDDIKLAYYKLEKILSDLGIDDRWNINFSIEDDNSFFVSLYFLLDKKERGNRCKYNAYISFDNTGLTCSEVQGYINNCYNEIVKTVSNDDLIENYHDYIELLNIFHTTILTLRKFDFTILNSILPKKIIKKYIKLAKTIRRANDISGNIYSCCMEICVEDFMTYNYKNMKNNQTPINSSNTVKI